MFDEIKKLLSEAEDFSIDTKEQLEQFRLKFLSKKGALPSLFAGMKSVAPSDRKEFGLKVNELKNVAENKLRLFTEKFAETETTEL